MANAANAANAPYGSKAKNRCIRVTDEEWLSWQDMAWSQRCSVSDLVHRGMGMVVEKLRGEASKYAPSPHVPEIDFTQTGSPPEAVIPSKAVRQSKTTSDCRSGGEHKAFKRRDGMTVCEVCGVRL